MQHRSCQRHAAPVAALLALSALLPTSAVACSTPVFRYALENWTADTWKFYVFHDGYLSAPDRESIDRLQKHSGVAGPDEKLFELTVVDTRAGVPKPCKRLYESVRSERLPLMVACYPSREQTPDVPGPVVWTGKIAEGSKQILESRKGRDVARGLVRGNCIVWILIEGGDGDADEKAHRELKSVLRECAETLKLPEAYVEALEAGGGEASVARESGITFETVRIPHDAAGERLLVQTLLRSEPDLTSDRYGSQPKAFAVYGKGRALPALVGRGINSKMIRQRNAFLVGPCSCEAKAANPGFQLPIFFQWNEAAERLSKEHASPDDKVLPSLHVASEGKLVDMPGTAGEGAVGIGDSAGGAAEDSPDETASPMLVRIAVIVAAILIAAAFGTGFIIARGRRE